MRKNKNSKGRYRKKERYRLRAYQWIQKGKLKKITKSTGDVIQYRYDAEGMRVKKVEDGSEVRYLMDGLRVLCEYEAGGGILRE